MCGSLFQKSHDGIFSKIHFSTFTKENACNAIRRTVSHPQKIIFCPSKFEPMHVLRRIGVGRSGAIILTQLFLAEAMCDEKQHVSARFKEQISKIRLIEDNVRQQWIDDEKYFRKLPARAWPQYQPKADEIPKLKVRVDNCCWNERDHSKDCLESRFNLATALLFNVIDQEKAIKIYELLTSFGDSAGMTALGAFQIEGLGCHQNAKDGSEYIKKAAELGYTQALYELGSLHYNGNAEPYIEEDNMKAFDYFQRAAAQKHIGGMYMAADMMISGEGGVKDYPSAIPLLLEAGNLGHRTARATLLDILNNENDIINTLEQSKK